MAANRYDNSRASRPISAGAALLINGALIAGLMFAAPEIVPNAPTGPFIIRDYNDPPTPPPEPEPSPQPRTTAKTTTTPPLARPDPVVPTVPSGPVLDSTTDPVRPSFDPPAAPGSGTVAADPPVAPPVMVDSTIDPRYANGFQPNYPGTELRAGNEGLVRVRVLIGVDGRVKAVERLASPSDAFFDVTRRHALARWRFRPATRDGIPVESWKEMTVRFRINV